MADVVCEKCGGPAYDNRNSPKRGPRSPIFKCKDASCGWAKWPEKKDQSSGAAQKAPAVPLEDLSAEYGKLLRSVAKNLATAAEGLPERMKPSFADAQAASATIWIQYRRQA
jgi:hypothetical protein